MKKLIFIIALVTTIVASPAIAVWEWCAVYLPEYAQQEMSADGYNRYKSEKESPRDFCNRLCTQYAGKDQPTSPGRDWNKVDRCKSCCNSSHMGN